MALAAPSILSADFANLEDDIKRVEEAGASLIHVDVMDGTFVPNITIGAPVLRSIRPTTNLPLDVHLMIVNPHKHISDFAKAGADLISFHLEAYSTLKDAKGNSAYGFSIKTADGELLEVSPDYEQIRETINLIRSCGVRVGISINPGTPVESLRPILGEVDLVLLMSVNPGFGGQSFMPMVYDKLREIQVMAKNADIKFSENLFDKNRHPNELALEVDGGVAPGEIAEQLKAHGVNILVAGSAIYKSKNMSQTITAIIS
jgi:ribulose-phosphate 3-epimerase